MSVELEMRTYLTLRAGMGEDHELDAIIVFTFSPGAPERGPSYASGGEPAEAPEIEIKKITLCIDPPNMNKSEAWIDAPDWLGRLLSDDDELFLQMCEHAADVEASREPDE
jgi:hypothetical protein